MIAGFFPRPLQTRGTPLIVSLLTPGIWQFQLSFFCPIGAEHADLGQGGLGGFDLAAEGFSRELSPFPSPPSPFLGEGEVRVS
jgi:hypothetical protein